MDNIDEQPIDLFMDRNDLSKVYARAGFTVGVGQTVEEALKDLRRHLGPEARGARIEKAWGTNKS